eukprot:jgi/Psemu1/44491/gm1.44491_g
MNGYTDHTDHTIIASERGHNSPLASSPQTIDTITTTTKPRELFTNCTTAICPGPIAPDYCAHTTASASNVPSHNMLTYSEYFQATASPFGGGPDRDLAYSAVYDYFAEDTDTPTLLGHLLDLFEAQAVGAQGIFLIDTFGRAQFRLVHGLRKKTAS